MPSNVGSCAERCGVTTSDTRIHTNKAPRAGVQLVVHTSTKIINQSVKYRVVAYVRQFDLVCERAYLSYLATTIYFLGVMLGGLTFGPLAEKFGRRPVLLVSLVASVAFSISLTLANSYVAFVLIRLVNGFFLQVG